jgi:hypothetical protein
MFERLAGAGRWSTKTFSLGVAGLLSALDEVRERRTCAATA